jgi:hypothetical protein
VVYLGVDILSHILSLSRSDSEKRSRCCVKWCLFQDAAFVLLQVADVPTPPQRPSRWSIAVVKKKPILILMNAEDNSPGDHVHCKLSKLHEKGVERNSDLYECKVMCTIPAQLVLVRAPFPQPQLKTGTVC